MLSQAELSKISGVTAAQISRLENGMHSAQARTVRKLAKALKVKPQDLVGDERQGRGGQRLEVH